MPYIPDEIIDWMMSGRSCVDAGNLVVGGEVSQYQIGSVPKIIVACSDESGRAWLDGAR